MCNDCVYTLTFEDGSGAPLRAFKTFGVPGAGGEGGSEDSATGGHAGGKGVAVDLGNGVTVTTTKVIGDAGGVRALPPVDVWSKRRAALKAKAAALSSATAGVAVTAAVARASAAAVTMSTSCALTPANVAKVGAAGVRGLSLIHI